MAKRKTIGKVVQQKFDKGSTIRGNNHNGIDKAGKKENQNSTNNSGEHRKDKNSNKGNHGTNHNNAPKVCSIEEENKNEYFIFEKLTVNENIKNSMHHYTWFYYFENIKLMLDYFQNYILNYSYYLLNSTTIINNIHKYNKRNVLLTNQSCSNNVNNTNGNEFKLNFNNSLFKYIEKITVNKNEFIADNKLDQREKNIINFIKKQNIKSMMYINDIFDSRYFSILFLIYPNNENDMFHITNGSNSSVDQFTNQANQQSYTNELGVEKGYEIILLRYSLEIMYFYKNSNRHNHSDNQTFSFNKTYNNLQEPEYIQIKNKNKSKNNFNYTQNQTQKKSNIKKKFIIDKSKYHTVINWRTYLNDYNSLKEYVVLDALNICSGMDGYIDDKNFNFDTLRNDQYSYLIQYKTELSIFKLIYAVTSLLQKKIRPIIYIPHWWYYDIPFCEDNITEEVEFQLYIFNELKKDGLLKIGDKKVNLMMLTMDEKDVDILIGLAMQNNAILCTNNNDIIKYYLNVNENAKVSKFISKGTFFVLTNFL
ncbi:conserved Plasmodium protein, unknown function [Plasmodium vinckei petteri]|uniref:Uncharacterized protein n=1 Tax=Plasmodium vinckei petteri TaxID=138298 RepID=A0A6V7SZQ2_PLAVN|nr:conserved Plasmodium protein, unknown function [Plasmodium vinckei petteri]